MIVMIYNQLHQSCRYLLSHHSIIKLHLNIFPFHVILFCNYYLVMFTITIISTSFCILFSWPYHENHVSAELPEVQFVKPSANCLRIEQKTSRQLPSNWDKRIMFGRGVKVSLTQADSGSIRNKNLHDRFIHWISWKCAQNLRRMGYCLIMPSIISNHHWSVRWNF